MDDPTIYEMLVQFYALYFESMQIIEMSLWKIVNFFDFCLTFQTHFLCKEDSQVYMTSIIDKGIICYDESTLFGVRLLF